MPIETNWGEDDLRHVRFDQSGDIIFLCLHRTAPAQDRTPRGGSWPFAEYQANDGPFQAFKRADITLTPGNYYGNTTLMADRDYFTSGHIGCLFRLISNGQLYKTVLGATRRNDAGDPCDRNWRRSQLQFGLLRVPMSAPFTLQRSFDGERAARTERPLMSVTADKVTSASPQSITTKATPRGQQTISTARVEAADVRRNIRRAYPEAGTSYETVLNEAYWARIVPKSSVPMTRSSCCRRRCITMPNFSSSTLAPIGPAFADSSAGIRARGRCQPQRICGRLARRAAQIRVLRTVDGAIVKDGFAQQHEAEAAMLQFRSCAF